MKRAFGTGRGYRALRFVAAMPPLHTSRRLVLHIRKANTSFFDSVVFDILQMHFCALRIFSGPSTDSNRHTLSEAFQKSFPFKIYLQSHKCKEVLDRFELTKSLLTSNSSLVQKMRYCFRNIFRYNIITEPERNTFSKENAIMKSMKKHSLIVCVILSSLFR